MAHPSKSTRAILKISFSLCGASLEKEAAGLKVANKRDRAKHS
jgi:hypothetical protein